MPRGQGTLFGFLWRRGLLAIPVLGVIAVVTFVLPRVAPGDPVALFLGEGANPEQVQRLNDEWGFSGGLHEQFVTWIANLASGDLGESLRFSDTVASTIVGHLGPTLSIAGVGLAVMVFLGIPIGLLAGHRRGSRLDRGLMSATYVGLSMPEFWMAMLLVWALSPNLAIFPVSGYVAPTASMTDWFRAIALPGFALAVSQVSLVARMVRDSVIDTAASPWVTSLRSRGLSRWSILTKHQLKSAAVATLTVIGNSLAAFLTAAVVVEMVFNIPGFGWLTVQGALQRDYPLLQGAVLVAATAFVAMNLVVDGLYAVIDPRIRAKGA